MYSLHSSEIGPSYEDCFFLSAPTHVLVSPHTKYENNILFLLYS